MEIGVTVGGPICSRGLKMTDFSCRKPDDISRGAGFARANQRQCVVASKGAGCELVGELLFPKCGRGFHPARATPSLCTYNCPLSYSDEGKTCALDPRLKQDTMAKMKPKKVKKPARR
jgi:hypothetical protein